MIKYLFSVCLLLNGFFLSAQTKQNTYNSSKDADPKAKALLKQIKDNLALDKGIEIVFEFKYSAAETAPISQKGTVQIRNKKFHLILGDQEMWSDQKTLWTYLKKRNEVNLQEALDIENDPLSPFQLLQIHDSPEFSYVMAGTSKLNGAMYEIIEFKPLDKNAEFFKIKAEVDPAKKQYKKIILYLKNGDQYSLEIQSQTKKLLPETQFVFDSVKFPGVRIEDLR